MATRTGGDRDQSGRAFLDRLVRELLVDHVMQGDAAPAFHGDVEILACAE